MFYRRTSPGILFVYFLLLLLSGPAASRAWAASSIDDLTGPWQLFVDDYPVVSKSNVVRTYHPFQKYAGNPVLVANTAWEQLVNIYGTVLPNETRTGYRMWYQNYLTNDPCGATSRQLYATSTNGINWIKPALNQHGWCGSSNNNMYFPGFMTSVMQTPDDPDPAKRYKFMNYTNGGWMAGWSSNGINVVSAPNNPVASGSDSGNFCWDPHSQQYLGYVKNSWTDTNGLRRRAVALTTSANFTNWTSPSLILRPDAFDDRWSLNITQRTHFYGLSAFPYETMYLGFLWIHRATNLVSNPPGLYEGYQIGPIFVELVSSRDGVHWTREEGDRPPILPLVAGTWDGGMIFTARAPLVEGNTIKLWYGGWKNVHDTALNKQTVSIGLATLRKDGFASLDAGATVGNVLTKTLTGAAGPLLVNYQTTNGGSLKVEVLDGNSNVLSGYSAADCVASTGNSITQTVTWAAHAELPASPALLRLRFILQNASVYSFMAGESVEVAEAPAISQHPVSRVISAGGIATFNVLATGTPLPAYQWQKNQTDLSDGGRYSGCATATLTISDVDPNDAASYRCVVTNAHGSVISNPAILAVATNAIGGITLKAIPMLSGDTVNEGRALAPDGKWVVGVSGSRGFLFNAQTTNLFNVRSADNAQSSIVTGVGYRTRGSQQEIVMSGLAGNWFTAFMTTNGTAFANKLQTSGGTIKVPVLPLANGLVGTSSDVFYATWSDNNSSDYQEYVGKFSGSWPMTPQWDVKGIPKPTLAGVNGISTTGRAVGWRGTPKAGYVLDWNGGGSTSPWFFNGLDDTTVGEALSVSADGTQIFGQSPVLDGRPGNWGYKKGVAATMPGPAAQLSVDELPNFLDTDGSDGSAAAPYGCTADGKYAVGTSYRGLEKAVLWDTSSSDPAKWTVVDLTGLAEANGGLNIFTRLVCAYSVVSNAHGDLTITGYGLDGSGNKRAFIMTVPPPTTPAVAISGSYPAGFTFTFASLGNRNLTNYLEYTTNLNPPCTWNTITSAPCTGDLTILSDPNPTDVQRFYRIRVQ